jgi:Sulfotransferase family
MVMPNFLIIGAAKAGTTALNDALIQHPQVYMSPRKEPNFFALEGEPLNYAAGSVQTAYLTHCVTDLATYCDRFSQVRGEIAIGEASPLYLYDPQAPERIQHYIPDAKLIAILRDPIERAYSNFLHHIRDGLETTSDFLEAVDQEEDRIANRWWWGFHYVKAGFYYEQLSRYFEQFGREQIKIYLYEDLSRDHLATVQDTFQFLGIDATFAPDMSIRQNVTGIPKNRFLHSFLNQKHPVKRLFKSFFPDNFRKRMILQLKNQNLDKPRLSPEARKKLLTVFREDTLKLQDLIQRDLSAWLQ